MSYIKHVNASDLKVDAVEHSALVAACTEIQEIMGLNPGYESEMSAEETADWLSEAMDEAVVSDKFSETTEETLRALGYVMPGDDDFLKEGEENGEEEVDEATEIPEEIENGEPVEDEKPVKKEKAPKEPKPKKEKVKKEKAPKEPKPKKEKAPKEPKPKVPGVIEILRNYVREHGADGFTIADAHKFICEKFPDRFPEKLLATCRVQLQNSRMGKEIGYTFHTVVDSESKTRKIHATPISVSDTLSEEPLNEEPVAEMSTTPF